MSNQHSAHTAKDQVSIKLTGLICIDHNWLEAKSHQANDVHLFKGTFPGLDDLVYIDMRDKSQPKMITPKATYPLVKHANQNYFVPVTPVPNTKIHVVLKKITGQVIYWA